MKPHCGPVSPGAVVFRLALGEHSRELPALTLSGPPFFGALSAHLVPRDMRKSRDQTS